MNILKYSFMNISKFSKNLNFNFKIKYYKTSSVLFQDWEKKKLQLHRMRFKNKSKLFI